MEIEDLEFIRDFADRLNDIKDSMNTLACNIEEAGELPELTSCAAWSICHQANLLESLFVMFKTNIDKKYWQEWQKKYPQLREDSPPI